MTTLAEFLGYAPKTLTTLSMESGLSRRDVEEAVRALRLAGEPICSGDAGVWIARNATELEASNARLHGRLREQYRTLRAQRRAERRLREQEAGDLVLWKGAI